MNDHPGDSLGALFPAGGRNDPPLLSAADGIRLMTDVVKRLSAELATAQSHFFFNSNVNFAARKREVEELIKALEKAKAQLADFQRLQRHAAL